MRLLYPILCTYIVILPTSKVLSQPIDEQTAGESSEINNVENHKNQDAATEEDVDDRINKYDAKMREYEEKMKAYDAKMREYEEKMKAYDAKMKEQEDEELESLLNETDTSLENAESIRVTGFFDTTFSKNFVSKRNFTGRLIEESSTFSLQNFNLMFSSQMSDQLSFLGELRFTFLPTGEERQLLDADARPDTTVVDPHTQETFRLGGLAIERVRLKWMPWEFFGVVAGYYLTPFGIWHLDHGSPTRLSVLHPFEVNLVHIAAYQAGEIIPDAQLGLQLLGRIFLAGAFYFDYALTISNGRGPADTVIDYDENKGLGMRLKFTYDKPNFQVALGGYGYHGTYTEKQPQGLKFENLEYYSEYAVATDFMIALYGFRFQTEFVRGLILYDESSPRPSIVAALPPVPDYVKNAAYGMLSYELPLAELLDGMTLTPYIACAFDNPIDWIDTTIYWAGLNFKPASWVTLKTEVLYIYSYFDPPASDVPNPDMWAWQSQLAVSF